VFQSFALMPWLTVQQNVELAMEARSVPVASRQEKAYRLGRGSGPGPGPGPGPRTG